MTITEKFGGEVTVVTVGPVRPKSALQTALVMGADKAIHVDDGAAFGDEYTISKVLAAVAKREKSDLIIAGYMAVDDGAAQVGPRLAEELGITHISTIIGITMEGEKIVVVKDVEGDVEIVEAVFPILVTAQQGLNEPRYPSLPGIMKAKKKPIEQLTCSDLDLNPDNIIAKTQIKKQYLPPKKQAGKILAGDIQSQVKELAKLLHEKENIV